MCDKCDHQCNKKERIKEHVLTVHEGVQYYCNKCGKECRITDKLKRHLLSKHDKIPFQMLNKQLAINKMTANQSITDLLINEGKC